MDTVKTHFHITSPSVRVDNGQVQKELCTNLNSSLAFLVYITIIYDYRSYSRSFHLESLFILFVIVFQHSC